MYDENLILLMYIKCRNKCNIVNPTTSTTVFKWNEEKNDKTSEVPGEVFSYKMYLVEMYIFRKIVNMFY